MCLISTLLTTKPSLRGAISRVDMFTLGTHLRGMLGIDNLEQHAGLLRLVADKLAKLVKSPATHAVTLRLAKGTYIFECPIYTSIYKYLT